MEQPNEIHVARQPIFDTALNVFAYELLFRSNFINMYDGTDGDQATHSVIANSFLLIGMETLTNGKKAFINFTANSLQNNIPAMLPKKLVAVEILEDIIPNEKILRVCKKLKQDGYLLVLDDFVFKPQFLPFIELADIIKVDFRTTPRNERQQLIRRLQNYRVKFLAEKVETQEEFQDARSMGYSYFQGYFFCKPSVLSGKNLPAYKANHLHILQEINRPELELSQIEYIIKRDVSLSYKLLRFINSAFFGFKSTISSLRQALTLLGQKELIKWVSIVALKGIADNKPGELILESLIRARFSEILASGKMMKHRVADAFLMGMFSHIDVLLDRPLQEILDEIRLDEEIKYALLDIAPNQFSILYKLIQTYEKGDWEAYSGYAKELELNEQTVLKAYRESLVWAHDLIMVN
ncbi:EAL domain protein [Sporomusa ovata DSM 2662]|uniref:Predicted signal transduction protein n=1 Tax=Sporomusa ovata TaxID=2378 RepID=A0A0U1KVP2_9FIRM|nr:HDOD domain-containing protein [Sporomusa ovata]EQB26652.1 diguanylate phosphodiesterase [Sporomusa ovata DSM 2662]CQR70744.1 Predicted signal transduction protein [Sporomusa ovata]